MRDFSQIVPNELVDRSRVRRGVLPYGRKDLLVDAEGNVLHAHSLCVTVRRVKAFPLLDSAFADEGVDSNVMANDAIDHLRIASPCSVAWDAMEGDERVRHCAVCSLNVYNLAGMTREEVRALLTRGEGRVCGRLYRRADGTVLTRDCPTGLRALRRRASRAAAAAVAALLSLPLFASSAAKQQLTVHGSEVKLTLGQAATFQAAAFTGVVVLNGDLLPGVTVTLRDETSARTWTVVTDGSGAFTFLPLSDGRYRVDLTLEGVRSASIEHLLLTSGVATHANIALLPIPEMGVITLTPEPVRHDPLSTTFTQSFIDKLPL